MAWVGVTENSDMRRGWAAVIMEVPRDLFFCSVSLFSEGERRRLERTHATNAFDAAIPTCHAFLPAGQLRGFAGSVSQDHPS